MSREGSSARTQQAFELKGRMLTMTVLRVLESDLAHLFPALERRVEQAPAFFDGMPVVLDLAGVASAGVSEVWLSELAQHLWQHGIVPVAVAAGDARAEALAPGAGLGILRPSANDRATRPELEPEPEAVDAPPELGPRAASGRLVTQPVRSGQQIYARDGDLVVLAAVSPGAEVMADGNVHVYGNLRGRALAGVQGNEAARVFCQQLNAELVAVAGCYQVSDQFEERHRGGPVQVRLRGETLSIESLGRG